jgi:hypothetical protein
LPVEKVSLLGSSLAADEVVGENTARLKTNSTTADNHMINGTKLLNVAGMTRGRRDGILKSEKVRHVVKIGPMHLKGVW